MFFCVYEKEDKRAMDLALITAKQVFELFILILCGVVKERLRWLTKKERGCFLTFLLFRCSIHDY